MTIELLNIDCMEYMKDLSDNAFDLAIVDPPYGIGKRLVLGGGGGWSKIIKSGADKWDFKPGVKYFDELFRISKNQIIWGGNFFDLPATEHPICWDKVRPNQKNVSEWEYAWTSYTGRAVIFKYCNNGGFVLKTPRIHPTQKPIALYKWLLENYAKPGQRILDTHLGSGSSAIAAHYFGVDFVGCELDKEYYEAACKRFKTETRQMSLFPTETQEEKRHFEQAELFN